jgi:hypothetical protein
MSTARRTQLAELDALTARLPRLCARMDRIWRTTKRYLDQQRAPVRPGGAA